MDFTYNTDDKEFFVDLESIKNKGDFITYVFPTKFPAKDFNRLFQLAKDLEIINPSLQEFLNEQLDQVPHNFIHQSLFNLMREQEENYNTALALPLGNPDDEEEAALKESYLEALQSEIKHIKKYLKLSHEMLKTKVFLGIVEILENANMALFHIDHISEPVMKLSFSLSKERKPGNQNVSNDNAPTASNVVQLPTLAKRSDREDNS